MTDPSVTLTTPYQDPPNTFRAQSVSDMYALSFTPAPFDMTYEVGIPSNIEPRVFTLTNLSVSNDLSASLGLPDYLTVDVGTNFVVTANTTVTFTISFSEAEARIQSLTAVGQFINDVDVTIFPLNVTGPVYIGIIQPPAPPVAPPVPPPTTPPIPPSTGGGGGGGGSSGIPSNPGIHPYTL